MGDFFLDPKVTAVNRLPARARRFSRSRTLALNGAWLFRLFDRPEDCGDFFLPQLDESGYRPIAVPGNWQTQGFGSPLYAQPWPAYDENKLVADEVEIALQINGKVRGRLMVPSTMTREEGEKTLPQNPEVIRFTEGKSIMKIIFVPGRLLNLVVK